MIHTATTNTPEKSLDPDQRLHIAPNTQTRINTNTQIPQNRWGQYSGNQPRLDHKKTTGQSLLPIQIQKPSNTHSKSKQKYFNIPTITYRKPTAYRTPLGYVKRYRWKMTTAKHVWLTLYNTWSRSELSQSAKGIYKLTPCYLVKMNVFLLRSRRKKA